MNNLTQLMKECSKRRPVTFSDISFPISQEIQSKIRSKNVSLKRKIQKIIEAKSKYADREAAIGNQIGVGKTGGEECRSQEEEINYLQAFIQQEKPVTQDQYGVSLTRERHELKEEDTAIQIYYLIAKRKTIFKVEQVQRRLKKTPISTFKKNSLKECDCCGSIGRHHCQHIFCDEACRKIKKRTRQRQTKSLHQDEDNHIQPNEVKKEEDLSYNNEPKLPTQVIDQNQAPKAQKQQDQLQQSSSSEEMDEDMGFLSSQSSYG